MDTSIKWVFLFSSLFQIPTASQHIFYLAVCQSTFVRGKVPPIYAIGRTWPALVFEQTLWCLQLASVSTGSVVYCPGRALQCAQQKLAKP